ncbi:microtubule-associated serine/threonine-protein kinase 3-like [Galendromus occidentalis]|uniref:Serine/threonine-protein kinase greatwall n=1 Tax=Galendromus occidentalis TaxID=34638 RepID=A0AAJ7SHH0_9ACAR|nr:microtubule-associated serine/threonine-protein kinase 3-like [Galendromus occidentalis]
MRLGSRNKVAHPEDNIHLDGPELNRRGYSDKVLKLKVLTRTAMRTVRSKNGKMVSAARSDLSNFVRENSFSRRPRLWATPIENYLAEQVQLTAEGLLIRIQNDALTFLDVREDLANLLSLFERISDNDKDSAEVLSMYLRALLLILTPVASALEEVSHVRCTNWIAVREILPAVPDSATRRKKRGKERGILVPSVSNLAKSRLLGAGGFGAVYKVLFNGRIVMTCKIISSKKLKRERVKCADKLVASVAKSHFVVKIYASFEAKGAFVSLMEYVPGIDLYRILKNQPSLSPQIIRIVIAQLCLAIQFLHMTGFIHRDIKPSNIMLQADCRICIIDFETCKVCSANFLERVTSSFVRKTYAEFRDGQSAGTLHYIAPEVLNRSSYGRAIDWWSLGVTAFMFGAQTLPFRGKDDKSLQKKITSKTQNVDFDLVLDPTFRNLIQKWLQKRPLDRLTGHRMTTIMAHEYFEGVDWPKLERSSSLGMNRELREYFMVDAAGRYTPRSDSEVCKPRYRPLLDIHDLKDQKKHTPLYTFVSSGMQQMLKSIDTDEPFARSWDDRTDPLGCRISLDLTCSQKAGHFFEGSCVQRVIPDGSNSAAASDRNKDREIIKKYFMTPNSTRQKLEPLSIRPSAMTVRLLYTAISGRAGIAVLVNRFWRFPESPPEDCMVSAEQILKYSEAQISTGIVYLATPVKNGTAAHSGAGWTSEFTTRGDIFTEA